MIVAHSFERWRGVRGQTSGLGPVLRAAVAVIVMASATACGGRDACGELFAAKRYEEAAMQCAERGRATGGVEAAWLAARANFELGRGEAVLELAKRLEGTPRESAVLELVAGIHQRAGRQEELLTALARRRELESAAGRHGVAAEVAYQSFYLAWEKGMLRPALQSAVLAFEEASRTGDPAQRGRMAHGLASVLYELGDLDGARRALAIASAGEGGDAASGVEKAERLNTEGSILLDLDQWGPAQALLEQALRLAEGAGAGDARLLRSLRLNLSEAALARGDLAAAEGHWRAACRHVDAAAPVPVSILYFSARLKLGRGDAAGAERDLGEALAQGPGDDWRWYLEHELGRALEARGDLAAAAAAYRRAIASVEALRSAVRYDELKASLAARKRRPHEALFALQARRGDARAALESFEAASARSFLDAFVASSSRSDASAAVGDPGEAWMGAVDRVEALGELLPALAQSPVVAPRAVEEILRALDGREAVAFFAAGDSLWRLEIRRGQPRLYALALDRTALEGAIDRLLLEPDGRGAVETLGSELFVALFAGSELTSARHVTAEEPLFVVPTGPFSRLPVGALRVDGQWLASLRPLQYAPSFSALASWLERPARRSPEGNVGDVVLADAAGDLPAAAREARWVAARLGVPARLGPRASREALLSARSARVLHLATHTGLGLAGPWIGLAEERIGAAWVLSRRIAPRLVVLASCASGARRETAPGGTLAEAFLAAGSDAVLATLVSVGDADAERFVIRFYEEGGAVQPVLAMYRAQRGLALEGAAPRGWAPFVLLGAP